MSAKYEENNKKKGQYYLYGVYCHAIFVINPRLIKFESDPLEVVSRHRDPQLQVGKDYSQL